MRHRSDWLPAAVLWLATVTVFAAGAGRLGFYGDDSARILSLSALSPSELWGPLVGYVSGRNLHTLWEYLSFQMVGDPVTHLPALHLLQSTVDGLVTAGFFLLLRRLEVPAPAALLAAGLFTFWPFHGETHFWLESLPMNLMSTLFVVGFAWTSLALATGRRNPGLWVIDAAAFLGALFTYDQVYVVLLLLTAARIAAVRRRRFAFLHLGYAAAATGWIWLRLAAPAGAPTPPRSAFLPLLIGGLRRTLEVTLTPAALGYTRPLFARVTGTDWLLGLTVAAALAGLSGWLLLRPASEPKPSASLRRGRLLILALLFYVTAYLPVWLWWPSPRHHYLPSLGLFAAVAVVLTWIFDRLPAPLARAAVVAAVTGPLLLGAVAGRGESRSWELAFTAKRQLFAELQHDLAGKQFLSLEDFPYYLGYAFLIGPHDARFGARLLQPSSLPLGASFDGSLGSAPAPRGRFFRTHQLDGVEEFRYAPGHQSLVVRFTSWDQDRLRYEKEPPRPPPYQLLTSVMTPGHDPFRVDRLQARRQGDSLLVTLGVTAPARPASSLTALFGYVHGPRFHPWGRPDREGHWNLQPVLLADPGFGGRLDQTWRLDGFPHTDRLQVEFYAASDRAPVLLGRAETAVDQ